MGTPRGAGSEAVPPGVDMRVVFDRTPGAYLPGSSVTGRVILTLEQQLAVTCEYTNTSSQRSPGAEHVPTLYIHVGPIFRFPRN